MNSRFLCYILGAVLLWSGCNRQTAAVSSMRVTTTPAIDGDITDWGHTLQANTDNSELQCFVANDEENLYIGLRIQDRLVQVKAMQMGMTFWVDTLGKQRHHRGIGFPLAYSDAEWEAWLAQAKGDRLVLEDIYAKNCEAFDLVGFVEESLRVTNLSSRDMKVAARFDALRHLIYEVKIPISRLIQRDWTTDGVIAVHAKVNDPKVTLDDDNGTLNDPATNSITQSNPLLGNSNPNTMGNPYANPNSTMRRTGMPSPNSFAPNVWVRVQLSK